MILEVKLTSWDEEGKVFRLSSFLLKTPDDRIIEITRSMLDKIDVLRISIENIKGIWGYHFRIKDNYADEVHTALLNAIAYGQSTELRDGDFIRIHDKSK